MQPTFLYMNETPAAEEFGMKWGERQQHAVLIVIAQSWGMEQSLKGFSEHSSFDWTNSASKPALTQPQKTASVSPCDCSAQLAKALMP